MSALLYTVLHDTIPLARSFGNGIAVLCSAAFKDAMIALITTFVVGRLVVWR